MAENKREFELQTIDKLIIAAIAGASLLATIITIFVVNARYKKEYQAALDKLSSIPYNETYKYSIENRVISFYTGTTVKNKYICSYDCEIRDFAPNQFIIDNDQLIPIYDGSKMIGFNVDENVVIGTFDDYPKTTLNNQYGIIEQNGKFGIVNKVGEIKLTSEFQDVDVTLHYIITLKDKTVTIYDTSLNLLARTSVSANGDLSSSEKNNDLIINIIGSKSEVLIFNIETKKFE